MRLSRGTEPWLYFVAFAAAASVSWASGDTLFPG